MAQIPDAWPGALLDAVPPGVADRQANPTADDLLQQILPLTPRGAAWGTDEAGDGRGASPVMRRVWRAMASWVADVCARDFEAATQTFPSAISYTLTDWENELGLPDACGGPADTPGRVRAVRARFAAVGGLSPGYFVHLAAGAGYAVTVEEPTQFLVDVSAVVGPDPAEGFFQTDESVCDGTDAIEAGFCCDEGACDDTPIETISPAVEGDGDRLETLTLLPADADGDAVAGLAPFESFFTCDDGECDGDPVEGFDLDDPTGSQWKFFVVHIPPGPDTAFACDESVCDGDPIEGFGAAPRLECLIRSQTPPHARVVFSYA